MLPFPGLVPPQLTAPPQPKPDVLPTPARLGPLPLPNRLVMAAMSTGFASRRGLPTPRLVAWYEARAAGGAGLVIVESTLVSDDARCRAGANPRLRLAEDGAIPAFARLVAAIKRPSALAAVQLNYPAVPDVRQLTGAEIEAIVEAFAQAARRARAAGFDAVELQCSHRGLLAHLLSPATNRRRDRYGRGAAGRVRGPADAVRAIHRAAGADLPVLVKLSADESIPRGVTPPLAAEIVRALSAAGATAFEVIAGSSASEAPIRLSAGVGEATQAHLAAEVRRQVAVPVLAAGRILSMEGAEKVLREGQADFLALGRALLADPAWLAKVRAGVEAEIIPCIGCMACFTAAPDRGTGCPVNGDAGREHLPPLEPAQRPRRIAVLGASLAGLELARIAAARGHQVEVATAGLPLGGLLGLRSGVPGNAEYGRASLYFGDRLHELAAGMVETPEQAAQAAQVVVDCRPGAEARPDWVTGRGVLLAGELLGRDLHELYGIGRRVAVVGPGALAAEAALFMAGWGRRPTVIVPGPASNPFPDVYSMHAARLLERLEGYKVPLVTGTTALRWHYDPDRKSTLDVLQDGAQCTLGPFHSAVSAAGWAPHPGEAVAATGWRPAAALPPLPNTVPDGATITLGDTPFAEPLRDMVAFCNLLARRL